MAKATAVKSKSKTEAKPAPKKVTKAPAKKAVKKAVKSSPELNTALNTLLGKKKPAAPAKQEPVKFAVGDTVSWTSSAAGYSKTKTGKIIAVVKKVRRGCDVAEKFRNKARVVIGYGDARDHESYLVSVPQGTTGKAKPAIYHPVVSKLIKL